MPQYIETTQECGHTAIWKALHVPKLGERIFCQACEDMRTVEKRPGSWYAKCMCRSCKWHQSRARLETLRANIETHLRNRGCNVVRLTNYDQTVSVDVRLPDGHDSGTGSATMGTTDAPTLLDDVG